MRRVAVLAILAGNALGLATLASSALAQPASPGLCARVPGFVGCATPLPLVSRTTVLPASAGDVNGTLQIGAVFNQMQAADVTNALGFVPSNSSTVSVTSMGPRAPIFVTNNLPPGVAGQNRGMQIMVGSTLPLTPGANDNVLITAMMSNESGRAQMWVADLAAFQVAGQPDGLVRVMEIGLNNLNTSAQPDAFTGAVPYRKNGIELFGHISSTARLTAAVAVWANDATGVKWWDSGMQLSRVFSTGIKAVVNPGEGVDLVQPFQNAFLWDASNSARVLRVDGNHGAVIDASAAVDFGTFLRGYTNRTTNVLMRNGSNYDMLLSLDSGATTTNNTALSFNDQGVSKWLIQKNGGNGLFFINSTSGNSVIALQGNGLYLLDNGALKQVVSGAADSGGTGFRTLRVAN